MSALPHRNSPKLQHAADRQFDVFPSYKGGHTTTYGGYVWEFVGDHPLANQWGFVAQHRLVGADLVGRPLEKGEVVHHRDNCRSNNDPSNLEVMSQYEHRRHHHEELGDLLRIPLTREQVRDALAASGGIKPAGRLLGCSHNTLRLRFADLCEPYQRVSPTSIDNPRDIERILEAAPRPDVGIHALADELKMSPRTLLRICERRGVKWVKKKRSDAGQHRPTPWQ